MKLNQKSRWLGIGSALLVMGLSGCISPTSSPRLPVVLGISTEPTMTKLPKVVTWPDYEKFGLVAISDSSGPEAAPPISSKMLSVLSRRVKEYLEKNCAVSDLELISPHVLSQNEGLSGIVDVAKKHHIQSVVLALFSSTELTQPSMLGEARMMTQMPGTTTHNSALVELGLIDVEKSVVTGQSHGESTESLDQLVAPIGENQPTHEEGLDILRANAGQQALDKALPGFTRSCASA